MSFKSLSLKKSYSSEKDDILNSFYIPVLKEAQEYHRITGYFSSTSFCVASEGISNLVKKNGKMKFIVNVVLSDEDITSIDMGLSIPEKVISDKFFLNLEELEENFKLHYSKVLGWLIAKGILEIKIGYISESSTGNAILHQKVGILFDNEGNIISFSGSNNESAYGWIHNSEKFKVFSSFDTINGDEYLQQDIDDFNELWENSSKKTKVIGFPEAIKLHLIQSRPNSDDEFFYHLQKLQDITIKEDAMQKNKSNYSLRTYQEEAIDTWEKKNYCGIFEMATGTGKTITALSAMLYLMNNQERIVVIISCPFLHIISQWEKTLSNYNFDHSSIIAHSGNPKWKNEFHSKNLDLSLKRIDKLIIFTTHDTVSSDSFESLSKEVDVPILFIADEVHGLGSHERSKGLNEKFTYRLGLSATPDRYFDETGTCRIKDYFKGVIFTFSLYDAINKEDPITGETYLTPYEYHPNFIQLTPDEMMSYEDISLTIAQIFSKKERTTKEELMLEHKLRERQDILKNAVNKYHALDLLIQNLIEKKQISHTLIYTSPQQIELVQQNLLKYSKITQHKFTNKENAIKKEKKYDNLTEREYLLECFDKGLYSILVAIKCLDEGVDVPSTRNAILLCSSGNPKEYIQRRGRVLRRFPGKDKALIYDFIALPNIDNYRTRPEYEKKMIDSELKRISEFAEAALNESYVKEIVNKKIQIYING